MKAAEKWLPQADKALIDLKIAKDGKVDELLKGYVSSFGALVIQSGLVPAVAFYCNTTSDAKGRKTIIDAIAHVLTAVGKLPNNTNTAPLLFQHCLAVQRSNDRQKLRLLKEDMVNASIVLKMMMRTYLFEKATENPAP